jgi:hypothetical protein
LSTVPGFAILPACADIIPAWSTAGRFFSSKPRTRGAGAQYVETLVYSAGRLLTSRKSYYTPYLNSLNLSRRIEKLMDDQHQAVLKDIADGKLDGILNGES